MQLWAVWSQLEPVAVGAAGDTIEHTAVAQSEQAAVGSVEPCSGRVYHTKVLQDKGIMDKGIIRTKVLQYKGIIWN